MKVSIEISTILEEQQEIINWSRKLKNKYIDIATIIEYLVSNKETQSDIINDELDKVRKIYNKYNNLWRKQMLTALIIDNYKLENDIKEGQMVTNGNYVGYAFNINYKTREFSLYSSKNAIRTDLIENFKIDDFNKI